jgi:hypothetical protein
VITGWWLQAGSSDLALVAAVTPAAQPGGRPCRASGKDQDVTAHRYDLVIVGAGGGNLQPAKEFAGRRSAVATAGSRKAGRSRRVARTVRRLAATRAAEMCFEPIKAR